MNTLNEILGRDEFLNQHPEFADMDVRLFLSACAYLKQEALRFLGEETLRRVITAINRRVPQLYHEYFQERKHTRQFYQEFFFQKMGVIPAGDIQEKSAAFMEEAAAVLAAKGLAAGNWSCYRPAPPEAGDEDIVREEAPDTIFYQKGYKIEEIEILLNSGAAVFCFVPVFASWGNDYTQTSGVAPEPFGAADPLLGYLPVKITGYDSSARQFVFTDFPLEEKEDYFLAGWAEESVTGQPGYGVFSTSYLENHMFPVFFCADKIEAGGTREAKIGALVERIFPGAGVKGIAIGLVAAAAILLLILYLIPGKSGPPAGDKEGSETGSGQISEVVEKEIAPGGQRTAAEEQSDTPGGSEPGESEKTSGEKDSQQPGSQEKAREEVPMEEVPGEKEKPAPVQEPAREEGQPVTKPVKEVGEKPGAGVGEPVTKPSEPAVTRGAAVVPPTAADQVKSKKQKPRFYYTGGDYLYLQVYPGNTVRQLERGLLLPKDDLYRYNPASKLRRLKAYTWLKVPLSRIRPYVIYRLKRGDTIDSLAFRFRTTRSTIMILNHIWRDSGIKPGHYALILKGRNK